MYKQKISIAINSDYDKEKLFDEFMMLMTSFSRTGQVVGGIASPYVSENELISYQTTLEKDALDAKYYDEWVAASVKNLETWCDAPLITTVAGQHIPAYKEVCKCGNRHTYVLFTAYANEGAVIDCGNCGCPVPVYQLEELTSSDRADIKCWAEDYAACDSLNMGCHVGEEWAIKQMSDWKSQLSKFGIDVCRRITKRTGVPSYYYLFNYRNISLEKDKQCKCPSCDGEWLLAEKWLGFYDFRCDHCKLLSTLTTNT